MTLSGGKTIKSQIEKMFEISDDFIYTETILNKQNVPVCYLQSLVDYKNTLDLFVNQLREADKDTDPVRYLAEVHHAGINLSLDVLVESVLMGKLIMFSNDGKVNAVLEPLNPNNKRSISEAQNENPIQTSLDAFTEDMTMNVGLIRNKLKAKNLIVQSHTLGSDYPRELSVLYLQGEADQKVVGLISDCSFYLPSWTNASILALMSSRTERN